MGCQIAVTAVGCPQGDNEPGDAVFYETVAEFIHTVVHVLASGREVDTARGAEKSLTRFGILTSRQRLSI